MIKLLLHKTKDYSMTNGVVFTDKSYKFDTLFVATKFLYEYISGDILKLTKDNKTNITNKIIDLFKLNSQGDGSKNYLSETLCFYKNAKIIEEINDTKSDVSEFKINDLFLLDFITVSIENSYIFQYLVVYQTFLNDGILNLYSKYCNCYEIEEKEKILDEISSLVQEKAKNVGDKNTKWAKNVVKFPLMILGLANDEKFVSRELNIEDKNIIPENLSANAKGTKSNSEKDNFYIHDFKINFVKEFLKELLLKDKKTFDRKKGGENVILYGVPGAGKSWTVNNEYTKNKITERIVFHPDYSYSDFVGQILPKTNQGNVEYAFVPGPFTKILKEAYNNPENEYALIIEEINRGNASSIFGDIFQLLDRDENGDSNYEIFNSDISKEIFNDETKKVKIPSNLSIICTMNTSDQNIFILDTAFQRRWNMRMIENVFGTEGEEKVFADTHILDSDVTWKNFCETMNDLILRNNNAMISCEDKRLGTHFVSKDELEIHGTDGLKNRRFPEKVIKYLWDDAFKLSRDQIFNADYNSLESLINNFISKEKNSKFDIFKDDVKEIILNRDADEKK